MTADRQQTVEKYSALIECHYSTCFNLGLWWQACRLRYRTNKCSRHDCLYRTEARTEAVELCLAEIENNLSRVTGLGEFNGFLELLKRKVMSDDG